MHKAIVGSDLRFFAVPVRLGALAVGPPPYGRKTNARQAASPVRPRKTRPEFHSRPRLAVRRGPKLHNKTLNRASLEIILADDLLQFWFVLDLAAGARLGVDDAGRFGLPHAFAGIGFHRLGGRKFSWLAFRHGKHEYGIDWNGTKAQYLWRRNLPLGDGPCRWSEKVLRGSRRRRFAGMESQKLWKNGIFSTKRLSSARIR